MDVPGQSYQEDSDSDNDDLFYDTNAKSTPKPPLQQLEMQSAAITPQQSDVHLPVPSTSPLPSPHSQAQSDGETNIDIINQQMNTVNQQQKQRRKIPIIAYKILLHILLLYAVIGVTYLLFFKSNTDCDCSGLSAAAQNIGNIDTTSTTQPPILIMETDPPTKEPTDNPSKTPTKAPSPSPTSQPTATPSLIPTNIPSVSPTPSPTGIISTNDILPRNGIIIWTNCTNGGIPFGWSLCDGNNGTPDLQGRFILAADDVTYFAGTNGGTSTHSHSITTTGTVSGHTLTVNEIPSHNHWYDSDYNKIVRVTGCGTEEGVDCNGPSGAFDLQTSQQLASVGGSGSHDHGFSASSSSGNSNHLPPYYVLCYIMKTDAQIWINKE